MDMPTRLGWTEIACSSGFYLENVQLYAVVCVCRNDESNLKALKKIWSMFCIVSSPGSRLESIEGKHEALQLCADYDEASCHN